ncbi:MAG: hypothetical protein ACOC0J_00470 [Myxococcota bacterium]
MKLGILFHDNCFDGMTSAGLFAAFFEKHVDARAEVVFGGLTHGPAGEAAENAMETGPLGPGRLVGAVNAVVDFRYIAHPRLHWWFDHHASAFDSAEDRRHFEADRSGQKYFDPGARSCAGFMARMLARDHGFDASPYADLIHWAEIIDSASFRDPKMAVELEEPALQVMTWIENSSDFARRTEMIRRMTGEPLAALASDPSVRGDLEPVMERHRAHIRAMRERHRMVGEVFFCDLTDRQVEAVNKFIPYYLEPRARYAVVVTRSGSRSKVSVGYSPWASPSGRSHDVSKICERFGGGGHPVVGAVSLARDEHHRAVEIGERIATELSR